MRRHVWTLAAGLSMLAACGERSDPAAPELSVNAAAGAVGAVYTMSNQADGNALLMYRRNADGTLESMGEVPSGGVGTGAGLGNQGGLVASDNGRWLFAVNAGDNTISSFAARGGGAVLTSNVPSGGELPLSIAVRGRLLYVLNAAGTGEITGFAVGSHGSLTPIPGSTRPLSGAPATGGAQVSFSPDGRLLLVTEKATNSIVTYVVGSDGLPSDPQTQASIGMTPFGFAFTPGGSLIVSEAFGGAPDASAASSYHPRRDGSLAVVSASIGTTETAACWIAITNDGRFAYTTNTGSGSLTGYHVSARGTLTLLDADGVTGETGAGSSPIDMAMSRNSRFVYALGGGNGSISAFRLGTDGSLTPVATYTGLPAGTNGLVAR